MSGLPSGYKHLEYIESSGTQYIDTGFKPDSNTRVVFDFEYIGGDVIFGSYDAAGANGVGLQAAGGKWYIYYGTASAYSSTVVSANTRLVADLNKNVSTLNGISLMTAKANVFAGGNPIILSGLYNATAPGFLSSLKIYAAQIYDNGTLVRDFVPCKNASGAVGLYDTVEGQFYANAGTGAFTAGPEIPAPETPTALQTVLAVVLQWAASANADRYDVYRDGAKLGSTEGTQYVDTTPEANQTYVYMVKAVNGGGESAGTSITVYTKSGYFEYKPLIESANFP